MTKITVVEDNNALRDLTVRYLKRAGYDVYGLEDAEDVFSYDRRTDIYIVDLNLPEMSGYELIKGIRAANDAVAIIILSAREKVSDIVQGYDVGADVYLTKPCDPEILLATVQRLSRKLHVSGSGAFGYIVNLSRSEAFGPNSKCDLSKREVSLLQNLAVAGERGMERHEVAEALGLDLDGSNAKAIDVSISRLRKKLSEAWSTAHVIETRRGFGYSLCVEVRFITE